MSANRGVPALNSDATPETPELAVSFVHSYKSVSRTAERPSHPGLWTLSSGGTSVVHKFPFPRNPSDFLASREFLTGDMPLKGAKDFERLPRFGLTGLASSGDFLYAGSWNGVYRLRKRDFAMVDLISNPLMNDLHGIYVDEDQIITVLTGKDTVVMTDHSGQVIDFFTVENDLTVNKDSRLLEVDWRFVSKQFRGATGIWHFNYIQKFGDEIWLTSRNIGAFVVVNLRNRRCHIRAINHKTVSLLHDGLRFEGEHYFTSIDGKIVIADSAESARFQTRESVDNISAFSRDMVAEVIRLEETDFGREPNWCRGIDCHGDLLITTVDGRYGEGESFGLVGMRRDGTLVFESRLAWEKVGPPGDLSFVTGFDVLAAPRSKAG